VEVRHQARGIAGPDHDVPAEIAGCDTLREVGGLRGLAAELMENRSGDQHGQAYARLTDGSLTGSSFVGEGGTAKQAQDNAIAKAGDAIAAGNIKYPQ
jgi:hypothetical protein